MPSQELGDDFSIKDWFSRMETNFERQLALIRDDIRTYQATTVTKAEFAAQMEGVRRDLDRVDRQGQDAMRDISERLECQLKADRDDWKQTRQQDKSDLNNRMMMFITSGGIVVAVIEFVVRLLVK